MSYMKEWNDVYKEFEFQFKRAEEDEWHKVKEGVLVSFNESEMMVQIGTKRKDAMAAVLPGMIEIITELGLQEEVKNNGVIKEISTNNCDIEEKNLDMR